MKATYTLSHPVLPMGASSKVDLLVTFSSEGTASTRRSLNLGLVIDRSGSMAGAPLKNAIQASHELVERMRPEDTLSVVTYDDAVATVLAPVKVKDKAAIGKVLARVNAGGCTNLSGGWLKGVEHVKSQLSAEGINRVLLLTDGQANAGITDPGQLINMAREKSNAGIITTTLGFGANFNEDLLIGMANAGEGHFYYIQSPEDAAGVFRIEMEGLGSLVAQNLEVVLKPAPTVKVASVLNRYRTEARGQEVSVGLGDVYATEPRQLAAELSVAAPSSAGPTTLATLVFKAQVVVDGSVREVTGEVPILAQLAPAAESAAVAADRNVLAQTSRLRIARVKDQAIELADKGELASASKRLREVISELSSLLDKASYELAEEVEQLSHYAQRLESRTYDAVLRKELRDQSYQAGTRTRGDLALRGTAGGSADSLEAVSDAGGGIVLECVREGGKLRVHTVSPGYDASFNVQFPRSAREEGVRYVVEKLETSGDGTFYRVVGNIKRLAAPGQQRSARKQEAAPAKTGKPTASKVTASSAADLPTTNSVGTGVIVQCVKEGSKLRARVVSDGYDPNLNIRFPREIREENVLYVVDEIITMANGSSYIACGDIRRLVQ
ncbi:vWA domain-containing protein [Pyxidicoccus xibeiensis]|uniref:vWA domain-containing protein n=1 Tax=Pyxidicoccus xibeiensis TaxID=2906759 RepID=UPI0020A73002|nr:VWA domain-containing protein [Pyxidicoccus xibeiensis]MCP3137820.1 VWA domain-containing protein [Pyxidicoccus xibeiensis]